MKLKYKKIFTAIFPGLIVAGLIFGANVYYDLDLGRVIVEQITRIVGMFETTATTTLASEAGSVFLATAGGRVGVATTTLTDAALTVAGNLTISGGKIFGANQEELWIGFNNDLIQVVRGPTPTTYIVCDSSGNCAGNYNYVGGTGTPNYLAKFSATSTLTTSTITEIGGVVNIPGTTTLATTAGFVGIATSTPYSNEKLTVYGNIWGSGNIILQSGSYNLTLTPATLTANRTITFPDLSGTVAVSSTAPITLSSTGVIGLTTPLAISFGGTATTSIGSAGSVVYSNGTTYAFTSVGTAGQPLLSGGSGAPTWGTLSVSFGGTGLTSVASGALLFGSGGTTLNTLSLGSPGTILTASTSAPYWSSLSDLSIATGTGAANYIAKWTGTNTLSTSTIVEVGGFVGIGTSSPAYLLDVYSAGGNTIRLGASSTDTVLIGGGEGKLTVGVVDPWLIQNTSAATTTLYIRTSASAGADDIVFEPAATEKLRILENGDLLFPATTTLYTSGNTNQLVLGSNGNVGIGTSAPAYTLDVNGSLRLRPISAPTATSGVIYYDSTADKFKCYQQGGIANCISNGVATIIVAASDSQQKYKADYICSGSGDQTTINNAISALPSGGGIIYLLEGTYNLTGPITITKSNVAIIGSGKATVLKRMWDETTANNSGVITVGDGTNSYEGILISNLQIDGNKVSYTNTNNHAIFFKKYIAKSKIKGNWIQNSAGNGIYFYATASGESNSYNIIEGNDIRSNYEGIYLYYSSYNTISGNTVQGNSSNGIYLSSSSNNTISGNTVQGNSSNGIYLSSSSNNTISGNTVQGNNYHGIYLYSSSNNTISGNKIHDNGGSGAYDGISISSNSDANLISSNDITDTAGTGYAINISSSDCENNYLVGNRYSGTGASSINDSGTGTIYGSQLYGSNLILKPLGNVGIGTTGPVSLLELYKTNASPILTITSATSTTYSPQIAFRTGTTPTTNFTLGVDISTGKLKIVPSSDISTSTGITIDSSGNVGIGTTTPGTILTIGTGQISVPLGSAAAPSYSFSGDLNTGIFSPGADTLAFSTGGLERMRIDSSGNVGIKTSPESGITLDVKGTLQLRRISDTLGPGLTTNSNILALQGAYYDSTEGATLAVWWNIQNIVMSTTPTYRLSFKDTNGNERLVILDNGNVGIGTTSPLYTLDVNGSLRLRPISAPTATSGVIYYDSTADKFKCYQQGGIANCISNGVATIIVAASDSQQKYKADYICSGSGDQTTINNAISALPSGGGIIYLLEGTYNLTGPITITKSNVAIIGSGKATVLKRMWNSSSDEGVITVGDATNAYEGILIENLAIDGNKGSYANSTNHAIFFKKYITKSKIKGNWIQNSAGYGIYFYATASGESNSYNIIEGNDIRSNLRGIYLYFSSNNTISGNTVQGNGYGISPSYSSNNTITGNTVQGNGWYGVLLYSSSNNTITGNTVQGNGWYGVFLYSSSNNNTITGNTVQGNGYHGVLLSSSSNNTISGNKIHDNGGSGAYDGISISSNSNANLISSNDITDTAGTGYAINISTSDCNNNYLVGNRYSGTGASSINDAGTGTIYGSQLYGSNLILKPVGNVGIGTTTPAATLQVYGNVKLNLPGAGTGYALCHTTQTGTTSEEIVDCTWSPVADYAEMYPVEEGIEPGDLVVPSSVIVETTDGKKLTKLTKTTQPYQSTMIGVVSDPKDITDFNVIGYNIKDEDNPMPVALSGRVLVKVSTENGEIKPGDLLTSASSTPGVAMKATEPGRVIGIALEGYKGERIGKITVFVNPHFWLGPIFEESTTTEQLGILDKFTLAIKRTLEKLGLIIENGIAQIKEIITEKLSAKVVVTNQLCLGQTCIDEAKLKELLEKTGTMGTTNNQATNNGTTNNQATNNGAASNGTTSNETVSNETTSSQSTSTSEQLSNEQLSNEATSSEQQTTSNEQSGNEQLNNEQLNSEQSGNVQSEPSTTTNQ